MLPQMCRILVSSANFEVILMLFSDVKLVNVTSKFAFVQNFTLYVIKK